jgi:hypothetical protein
VFIVDNILFSPVKGVLWIMKELHKHVQQEQAAEAERLTARLSELYMLLETGQLTAEEFDEQETQILDRLDEIQAQADAAIAAGEDPDDVAEDEEDGEEDEDGETEEEDGVDDSDDEVDSESEADELVEADQMQTAGAAAPATAAEPDHDNLLAAMEAELEQNRLARQARQNPSQLPSQHPSQHPSASRDAA